MISVRRSAGSSRGSRGSTPSSRLRSRASRMARNLRLIESLWRYGIGGDLARFGCNLTRSAYLTVRPLAMDTKLCRHCKQPIHLEARICQHCRSSQSWWGNNSDPRFMIGWLAVVVAVFVPLVFFGINRTISGDELAEAPTLAVSDVSTRVTTTREGARIFVL